MIVKYSNEILLMMFIGAISIITQNTVSNISYSPLEFWSTGKLSFNEWSGHKAKDCYLECEMLCN